MGGWVLVVAGSDRLEAVPRAVVCGFEWGMEGRGLGEVEQRLALVGEELRGFAYEGATMAFTILDAAGRGHRARDLAGFVPGHTRAACLALAGVSVEQAVAVADDTTA